MRGRWLAVLFGVLVLVVGAAVLQFQAGARQRADREQKELDNELALAREAGLPTTLEEFLKTVPVADPVDNAAPFVQALGNKPAKYPENYAELGYALTFKPTPAVIAEAKAELAKLEPELRLADEVMKRSKYVAKRDYSLGPALMLPDAQSLKSLAKDLLLRAQVKAAHGHHTDAIEDITKARKIDNFCQQDPLMILHLVGESVTAMVMQVVCELSLVHRGIAEYRHAAASFVEDQAIPNLRADLRYELVSALQTVELCATKEGREQIGLSEEDAKLPATAGLLTMLQSPTEGKVKVVRGFRLIWEAAKDPADHDKMDEGSSLMWQGMMAFPTAAKLYESLDGEGPAFGSMGVTNQRKARLVLWKAVVRGLQSPNVAKSIKADDLVSPVDGQPVRYSFDGQQIVVLASADGKPKVVVPRVPKSMGTRQPGQVD